MGETTIQDIKDDIIRVRYKGQLVKINISKELAINENLLNTQLKQLPSNYAFLCLLRDKAIRDRDRLEKKKDAAYSRLWLFYRDTCSNNDTAAKKAECSSKYIKIEREHLKAIDKANKLISVCRAYESRERILQTLSANIRKQS